MLARAKDGGTDPASFECGTLLKRMYRSFQDAGFPIGVGNDGVGVWHLAQTYVPFVPNHWIPHQVLDDGMARCLVRVGGFIATTNNGQPLGLPVVVGKYKSY